MAPKTTIETLNVLPLSEYRDQLWPRDSTIIHTQNGISTPFSITLESASTLSSKAIQACFDLIASTSSADYESSSIGWSPAKKKKEMRLPDLRYVLLAQRTENEDYDWTSEIEGFMSFMLTYEDGYEVIYLYEIHLPPQLQGKGFGKRLMEMIEEMGRKCRVEKAMLTVFRSNEAAIRFYEKLGYGEDELSPRARKLRGGVVKESDYMILSKALVGVGKGKGSANGNLKKLKEG